MTVIRHYFALQTNPGEQFYLFTSLAAWLMRKCGKPLEQPQEVCNVLLELIEFVSIKNYISHMRIISFNVVRRSKCCHFKYSGRSKTAGKIVFVKGAEVY